MGCFSCCTCSCCEDKTSDQRYQDALPKFSSEDRKCRDVLGLVAFVLFWIAMISVFIAAIADGSLNSLLHGRDYRGQLCGTDSAVSSKSLITYPRLTEDILAAAQSISGSLQDNLDKINFFGVCASSCPDTGDYVCSYEADELMVSQGHTTVAAQNARVTTCKSRGYLATRIDSGCTQIYDECWQQGLKTFDYISRCLPLTQSTSNSIAVCLDPSTESATSDRCRVRLTNETTVRRESGQSSTLFDQLGTVAVRFALYFGDLVTSWYVVLVIGFIGASLVSFIFIGLLKCLAPCMVWSIILLSVIVTGILALLFAIQAGLISSSAVNSFADAVAESTGADGFSAPAAATSDTNVKIYQGLTAVFTVLIVVEICVIAFARTAIKVGIQVLKLAGKVLQSIPSIIICPGLAALAFISLFLYYIFGAGLIYTMGEFKTLNLTSSLDESGGTNDSTLVNNVKDYEFSDAGRNLQILHLFGFLWTNQVISAISMTTIAGAVARWYFVRRDYDGKPMEGEEIHAAIFCCGRCRVRSILWASFRTAMRYHFGSLATGALFIALFQLFRAAVMYMVSKAPSDFKDNLVGKTIKCCVVCLVTCVERCLKYLTRNAYIQIAIFGKSFFPSAYNATYIIVNNAMRVSILGYITFFLILLGKIVVTIACAILAFLWLSYAPNFQTDGSDTLSSIWLPLSVTTLLAFAIASNTFYAYDVTIDSVFLCFLNDEKLSKDHQKPMFNEEMGTTIGIRSAAEAAKEERDKANGKIAPTEGEEGEDEEVEIQ